MTYHELCDKYGRDINTWKKRRNILQIEPAYKIGKVVGFSPEQVYQLVNCNSYGRQRSPHDPIKVRIISEFNIRKNAKTVARFFGLNNQFVFDTMKESREGFIIVESSMNRNEHILEIEGADARLFDRDGSLVADYGTKPRLCRKNIEAHQKFLRRPIPEGKHVVEMATTENGKLWVNKGCIMIKNFKPFENKNVE